jgi:hypothetical protein
MELVLTNSSNYPYCETPDDVANTLTTFGNLVDKYAGRTDSFNCFMPCKFFYFANSINEFHRNSWIVTNQVPEDEFKLDISLSSKYADVHTETQIYDLGNSIGQLGGNLGLLLGFSCLSAYFYLSGLIQKVLKNKFEF